MGNALLHIAAMSKHRTQTAITADPNGRSLASISGTNPADSMDVCRECFVLPVRGLYDGLITRPEDSYREGCV
jgi:hypothetical protein